MLGVFCDRAPKKGQPHFAHIYLPHFIPFSGPSDASGSRGPHAASGRRRTRGRGKGGGGGAVAAGRRVHAAAWGDGADQSHLLADWALVTDQGGGGAGARSGWAIGAAALASGMVVAAVTWLVRRQDPAERAALA